MLIHHHPPPLFIAPTPTPTAPLPGPGSSSSSPSALDPSLIQADLLRKSALTSAKPAHPPSTETRPSLFQIVFNFEIHNTATKQQKEIIKDRKCYGNYLVRLKHDIALLDSHLKKTELPLSTLPRLYREAALKADISFLGIKDPSKTLDIDEEHTRHFATIADRPHLLLSHFCVHYLGFLFGGQRLIKQISNLWGDATTHLKFEEDARQLREEFTKEMEDYLGGISDPDFIAFQKEIALAWKFSSDILKKSSGELPKPPARCVVQ